MLAKFISVLESDEALKQRVAELVGEETGLDQERLVFTGESGWPDNIFADGSPLAPQLEFLRGNLLGNGTVINTVFGRVRQLYADYTAQGKQFEFSIQHEMWFGELFGNVHTANNEAAKFSHVSRQTAVDGIKDLLKADRNTYKVLTIGQGTTGAVERLFKILGLDIAPATQERLDAANQWRLSDLTKQIERSQRQKALWTEKLARAKREDKEWIGQEIAAWDEGLQSLTSIADELRQGLIPEKKRPVVLITGQEHHSNSLPYDGVLAEKIIIPFRQDNLLEIDLQAYEEILRKLQAQGREIIVSLSAASNVTGHVTDIVATAELAKKYGALTIYDHAASLAYRPIDLSLRTAAGLPLIDAVVASPHKLPGGPGSTGLLVFNKAIYPAENDPSFKGGGTVWHVSPWRQVYSRDIEERESSGTPNGEGIRRLYLAMELTYRKIGFANIEKLERQLSEPLLRYLLSDPNIVLYGDKDLPWRVPIFPFNVRYAGNYLHPNFVAQVLSDLLGIQTRPGCSCAGEYGHHLLGISEEDSETMRRVVEEEGIFAVKPGWVRLNPHWLFTPEQGQYIIESIKLIARHGYKLLALYKLNKNGNFIFRQEELRPAYYDVTRAEASSLGVAQAYAVFRHRQRRSAPSSENIGKYDYLKTRIAVQEEYTAYINDLIHQLEAADKFLQDLPENSGSLKFLRKEDGAPLPLLYQYLDAEYEETLARLRLRQSPPAP
ncbi:putative selenocysteine lyase [Candidatus Termititenax persephonae]|uniref:Selenocysteine lyase n=1 Tax=Candidatus Termititenax persephonae TaxID=2218525 RepID=A0A388TH18_9BACT|nr:putative selenocysteine lyase [Candidatus Termititenax persephonae]